jgi:hypothetical protein
MSSLDAIDQRLHAHFGQLAELKREAGHPVFALEHGLAPDEVDALREALEANLQKLLRGGESFTSKHWLSWVVHAAEHGYSFEGLEFWPSFSAKTPSWERYIGVRGLLRDWFVKFRDTYRGVWPAGGWAANYPYIAWPITNALLPSDLQTRLAESMFQMRFRLGATGTLTPTRVGRLVAAYSHHGSNRYLNFLAQGDLVGRIVLALLHANPDEQDAIYPPTLKRIIADLNRTRVARRMLQDVRRHFLHGRPRSWGPSALPGPYSLTSSEDGPPDDAADAPPVLVRTGVLLERSATGQWSAALQLPSFQALSNEHAEFARHLSECLVNIPCHGEAWFPARTLVTVRRERTLQRWPGDGEPLLRFSESLQGFNSLTDEECRLPSAPCWIFRLNAEGSQARMSAIASVHPGRRYLVLARERESLPMGTAPISIGLSDVHGCMLDVPASPSDAFRQAMTSAGISVSRGLRVEPLGILPRQWDGDTEGEWLTTETPIFSVGVDHEVAGFDIAIDGGASVTLVPEAGQSALIFALPRLGPGRHTLTITSRLAAGSTAAPGRALLRLMVREPSTWIPGQLCHPAMVVNVTPLSPSLDDLVDGRMSIQVEGDPARKATFTLVLLNSAGAEASRQVLFHHAMPVRPADWEREWKAAAERERDDYAYLTASGGYIEVAAEELGFFRVPLRREAHALRWVMRNGETRTLCLVDDGEESAPLVSSYRFATPAREEEEPAKDFLVGLQPAAAGGLYVARVGNLERGLVVAPANPGRGWDVLGERVDAAVLATHQDLSALSRAYQRWAGAEAAGFAARIRRDAALRPVHQQMLMVACGPAWMRIEELLTGPKAPAPLWDRVESAVAARHQGLLNFAIALGHRWSAATGPRDEAQMLRLHAEVAVSFGWRATLAAQAWNLAVAPRHVDPSSVQLPAFQALERDAVLVRAARYLLLRSSCGGKP